MTGREKKKIEQLQERVRAYYRAHKRNFPWRETRNPYRILVSEVMLQQTQVARVLVKYPEFIGAFPTVQTLAKAPLAEVLRVWQGMGYNRRAKFLKQASKEIVERHNGKIPSTIAELLSLPGVGKSTAGGILAFAYNIPVAFIETNIRRVFIHHFFPKKKTVSDSDILPLVEATLNTANPREWYYALFDYGTHLAQMMPNPNRRSRHHAKQSVFEGSRRQIRGRVLRVLLTNKETAGELFRHTKMAVDNRKEPWPR